MSALQRLELVSVEDYLANEQISPNKHEYLGGVVYAMSGARNRHNHIAANTLARLHTFLRGKPCRAWNSDTKVHVRLPTHERFYYPDVMVVCESNAEGDTCQDEPVVIFEVLSRSTRRTDEGEKRDAYLTIPSLLVYVLVEQETPAVVMYRRCPTGFVREVHHGLDSVLSLGEIGVELPLNEVYEGLQFSIDLNETSE